MVTDVTRASGIETFKFEGSVDSDISIFGLVWPLRRRRKQEPL
jgi:hypothetical protein